MKLFVCEKPSQAADIAPHVGARKKGNGFFAGDDVTVTWAIGHLVELAKPEHYTPELKFWNLEHLPVVPNRWHLEVKEKTKAQYSVVSRLIKEADEVVIATDADREGEVIARELMQLAGYKGPVSRLWLSAFDDASIRKALEKLLPGNKTLSMYFSGMGRGRADWLAGMNLTMAMTKAFGSGGKEGTLHCGRVQTPVLALIVRRERAIANFIPKRYFQLGSEFMLGGMSLGMGWQPKPAILDKDGHVTNRDDAEDAARRVRGQAGEVSKVETTPETEKAPLPYSLGALQREASAKHGMKAQAVLDAAQALYEKHKATTYPRTDCEYLPVSMIQEAAAVLDGISHALPDLAGFVGKASKALADGFAGRAFNDKKITAHHAIIPTQNPNVNVRSMSATERTVYEMICRRFLAQFLGDHDYLKTVIEVSCEGETFRATGKVTKAPGWRELVPEQAGRAKDKDGEETGHNAALPKVSVGEKAWNVRCEVLAKETKPPRRYTEGTLLNAMESIDKEIEDPRWKSIMRNKEKAGLGTDATRSAIIENLFKREYIQDKKKELFPTERGNGLIALVEKISPEIADPVLTAQWEDQLAQIEQGQLELDQFEQDLAKWLNSIIASIKSQAGSVQVAKPGQPQDSGEPGIQCPACGKPMRRIKGSKGYFWGCSGFKDGCKSTLPDKDGKPAKSTQSVAAASSLSRCPSCQKPLRRIDGPRGPFWGCTGYPQCKHTQPDEDGKPGVKSDQVAGRASSRPAQATPSLLAKAGETCPDCNSGLLINKVLKDSGKPFVGCNRFPACRFFAWPAQGR